MLDTVRTSNMATLNTAVELPVGRHSVVDYSMTANIQDPTSWDLVANDGTLTRHTSKQTTVSEHPNRTVARTSSRPSSRGQLSVRTKASPAVEFPPQELEAQPLSYFPPRQSSNHNAWSDRSGKQTLQETQSDAGHTTQSSDDYSGSATSESTTGTAAMLENQVYSIPMTLDTKEESIGSPVLSSNRSVSSTSKKAAIPTSKYKKKSPPSLRASVKSRNMAETPLGSPNSGNTQLLQSPTFGGTPDPMPAELPTVITPTSFPIPAPTPPPDAQARQGQAPLQHAKSTASVRKARALHSHPSIPTIRDEAASSPQLTQPSPNLSTARSRKSTDSRNRPSLYDLQEPSPAPNTPLPDLPVGVQSRSRPASRDVMAHPTPPPDAHVRPGISSGVSAPMIRRQDASTPIHAEMANFMTSNSKIIFRRFHDVHVRLLLTLQDEISTLEKELAEIENVDNPIDVDRESRRIKVLSELRKLMAEYDHLFANWNLMQSSKADTKTREDLEKFLKQSGSNPSATISTGAVDDLLWLQTHSKDLSCVDLNPKKDQATVLQREITSERKESYPPSSKDTATRTAGAVGGGVGVGGFAALFASCTGRRK